MNAMTKAEREDLIRKECRRCAALKSRSEFHRATRAKDKTRPYCKACDAEFAKEYRTNPKHRETIQARDRRWRSKNPERFADHQLKVRLGIEIGTYGRLLQNQGSVCAICKHTNDKIGKRLAVDHCHDTGVVRGLLCNNCNSGIGFLCHDVELLRAAVAYLERSPT